MGNFGASIGASDGHLGFIDPKDEIWGQILGQKEPILGKNGGEKWGEKRHF